MKMALQQLNALTSCNCKLLEFLILGRLHPHVDTIDNANLNDGFAKLSDRQARKQSRPCLRDLLPQRPPFVSGARLTVGPFNTNCTNGVRPVRFVNQGFLSIYGNNTRAPSIAAIPVDCVFARFATPTTHLLKRRDFYFRLVVQFFPFVESIRCLEQVDTTTAINKWKAYFLKMVLQQLGTPTTGSCQRPEFLVLNRHLINKKISQPCQRKYAHTCVCTLGSTTRT